jgi:hypothetical protein
MTIHKIPNCRAMFRGLLVVSFVLLSWMSAGAQAPAAPGSANAAPDYSGMYSFLREGEFVQVTVEAGRVSGFVSRYGDTESDRGMFLDHSSRVNSTATGSRLRPTWCTASRMNSGGRWNAAKARIRATKPTTC